MYTDHKPLPKIEGHLGRWALALKSMIFPSTTEKAPLTQMMTPYLDNSQLTLLLPRYSVAQLLKKYEGLKQMTVVKKVVDRL